MRYPEEPVELQPAPPDWRTNPPWGYIPLADRSPLQQQLSGEHPRGVLVACIAVDEDERAALVTAIGRYKTNGLRPAPYVQQDLRRQHPGDSTLVLTHAVRTDINTALTEAWSTARTWIQGSLAGESVMAALWVHDPAVVALPRDQAGRESRLILELKLRVDAGEMPWTRGVPWGVEPVSMSVLGMAAERRRLLTDCAVRTLLAHDPVTVACGVLAGAINITAASQWP